MPLLVNLLKTKKGVILLKNKSFSLLATGQSLANAGDVFYILALISVVYHITESMFYVSLVPLTNMISGTISGILAPLIIDKYKLKRILVYSQFCKTLILLMITLFNLYLISNQTIYIIYILVFFISFLDGWASPASSALLPILVPTDKLTKANSLLSSLNQFIQLAGWAIGGILAAFLHSVGLFWLTLWLYVLSTIMLALIDDSMEMKDPTQKNKNKILIMIEGWRIIVKNKTLLTVHLLIFCESIANTVWISAILYPYIQQRLKVGTEWWGYINTSLLLGFLIAGIYGLRYSDFVYNKLRSIIILGSFIVFVTTFLFGLNTVPWVSLILIGLYGSFQEIKNISIHTLIQGIVSDRLLAKVYAAESAIIMLTFGISTVLMGVLGDKYNIIVVYLVSSLFLCISFIIVFVFKDSLVVRLTNDQATSHAQQNTAQQQNQ
ncbi:MFS transporter [Bacillus salipaludis]|uniref:MFS transporter n=1 Tax=Bacillus salipaludis TaxID=2547811 RepID=A0A4R5VJS0_9BACI|nr:MFS transporter [Bacillus salipaludis]